MEGQYSVFGVEARAHPDLNTLIKFHGTTLLRPPLICAEGFPVSKTGVKLTKPVGELNNKSLAPLLR